MKKSLILTALIVMSSMGIGQITETLLIDPSVTDGMCVDKQGNVYTASGGYSGFEVGKFDVETEVFYAEFITGLTGPVDVDFLNDSILLITNYDINTASSYNMNTGELVTIAEGLDGPAGILAGKDGNYIYITNWGGAPAYVGNQIHKIDVHTGTVWVYIESDLLYRPQAIAYNLEEELLVQSNGNLYKINEADSTLSLWTELGAPVGNMVFRKKDSCIYATANGIHEILKIDRFGAVTTFSGGLPGDNDGDISEATYSGPLGITFSPGEDTLYIAEALGTHRLRRILMTAFTELPETDLNQNSALVYPNPLNRGDDLVVSNGNQTIDHISIYKSTGELVYTQFYNNQQYKTTIAGHAISNLATGNYLIRIENSDQSVMCKKLVIK